MKQRESTDVQQLLSRYIKVLRQNAGLTQGEVAEQLKITRQGYEHYEKGTRNLSIETLLKLSDLYEMTMDQLYRGAVEYDRARRGRNESKSGYTQ